MSLAIDLVTVPLDSLPDTPSMAGNPEHAAMYEQLYVEALGIWYDNEYIEPQYTHLLYVARNDEEFAELYISAHCR
jgi:hypothetical protein